jgi:hypothetical protein
MKTTIRYCCAVLVASAVALASVRAAGSEIKGTFTGDGKPAKLAYVSAHKGEPFSGKDTIVLVFTEKDHSKDKKPDIKASFGNFGSALILTVDSDGDIVGCEVAHMAHAQKPFSSIGRIKTSEFKNEGGQI